MITNLNKGQLIKTKNRVRAYPSYKGIPLLHLEKGVPFAEGTIFLYLNDTIIFERWVLTYKNIPGVAPWKPPKDLNKELCIEYDGDWYERKPFEGSSRYQSEVLLITVLADTQKFGLLYNTWLGNEITKEFTLL